MKGKQRAAPLGNQTGRVSSVRSGQSADGTVDWKEKPGGNLCFSWAPPLSSVTPGRGSLSANKGALWGGQGEDTLE